MEQTTTLTNEQKKTTVYGSQAAFPFLVPENNYCAEGLTKREYFAGLAMQGIIAGADLDNGNGYFVNDGFLHPESIAKDAVAIADALLIELSKPQP